MGYNSFSNQPDVFNIKNYCENELRNTFFCLKKVRLKYKGDYIVLDKVLLSHILIKMKIKQGPLNLGYVNLCYSLLNLHVNTDPLMFNVVFVSGR